MSVDREHGELVTPARGHVIALEEVNPKHARIEHAEPRRDIASRHDVGSWGTIGVDDPMTSRYGDEAAPVADVEGST